MMKSAREIMVSQTRIILSVSKNVTRCMLRLAQHDCWMSAVVVGCLSIQTLLSAAPATTPSSTELEVNIQGQYRGRLEMKRIVAPITLNFEELQNFPEDPAQKLLSDRLPISQSTEFNGQLEVKGHAPFWPWVPSVPEPPFLRMESPLKIQIQSCRFEILNPLGHVIYRQEGSRDIPKEFVWNGKDAEKKLAVVDRLYTPQLTYQEAEGKTHVAQGKPIIFPFLAYPVGSSYTLEISLARLFRPRRAEFSMEGTLLLSKACEWMRERGLTKIHARISQTQPTLAVEREKALATALQKMLHLTEAQMSHNHNIKPSVRGEIAVLWARRGGRP